jgi:hypothetical protein
MVITIDVALLKNFEITFEFGGIDRHGKFHGFRMAKYKYPN